MFMRTGARRRRRVSGKHAGQSVEEERIGRSEPQSATAQEIASPVCVVEQPAQLGCRKYASRRKRRRAEASILRRLTAAALLSDWMSSRPAKRARCRGPLGQRIPCDDGFPLVGQAYALEIIFSVDERPNVLHELFGIMLNPSSVSA